MAKSKKKADSVFLVCEKCGEQNYVLRRKAGGEKLNIKKYCSRDRAHTLHKEKRK
jgi:large subunit ribosomal protein L33